MTAPAPAAGLCEVCGERAFRVFDGHKYCTRQCQDIATSPVRKPIRTAAEIMAQVPADEVDHAASIAKYSDPSRMKPRSPAPPGFEVYQRPTPKRSPAPTVVKETPVPASPAPRKPQAPAVLPFDKVKWGDPPATDRSNDGSKVALAVEQLKERPGVWAQVIEDSNASNAGEQFRVHGCQITRRSRRTDDGRKLFSVWARWPVDGAK